MPAVPLPSVCKPLWSLRSSSCSISGTYYWKWVPLLRIFHMSQLRARSLKQPPLYIFAGIIVPEMSHLLPCMQYRLGGCCVLPSLTPPPIGMLSRCRRCLCLRCCNDKVWNCLRYLTDAFAVSWSGMLRGFGDGGDDPLSLARNILRWISTCFGHLPRFGARIGRLGAKCL